MKKVEDGTKHSIRFIRVNGLHHQLDVELTLQPGLNVLYGKNGRGKTTLLHIIANILELDFLRFSSLGFSEIYVETFAGSILEIFKVAGNRIKIKFQKLDIGSYERSDALVPVLSSAEQHEIRSAFGGRPIYLPAFRSILERVRNEAYTNSARSPQYERIKQREIQYLNESKEYPIHFRSYRWQREEMASSIARKTVLCREWFGPFVPVIRYPSLEEVSESLSNEFTEAQISVSQSERRMLSSMFIDVFVALTSKDETPPDWEVESLMKRVSNSLEMEDGSNLSFEVSDQIGARLSAVIRQVKDKTPEEGAAQKRVLKLYADMLESRNRERTEAFSRVKKFEGAINGFLDDKTLHVSERVAARGESPDPVYVETNNNKKYSLNALSSGERQVLNMLFSATRMSTPDSGIFLIDEPELSLHVDWQRIILSALKSQVGNKQILACTHSPEVGADHIDAVQMFTSSFTKRLGAQPGSDGDDFVMEDDSV